MNDAQENGRVMELIGWFMQKGIQPADALMIQTKALITTLAYLSLGRPDGTMKRGADLVSKLLNNCSGKETENVLRDIEDMVLVKNNQTLEC
jgi:hypothetical protein